MGELLCLTLGLLICAANQYGRSRDVSSWESVAALTAGSRIRVESAHEKRNGTMVSVSGDALTCHDGESGNVTVPRSEVRRVYLQSSSRRLRNTVIGTAIGVAAGAVLYGTLGRLFRNEGQESGYLFAVPIAAGAGIGAAMPGRRMVLFCEVPEKS